MNVLISHLVMIAAPSGMPRKTATLVATVEYETDIVLDEWLMILMNNTARGAYSTIWRTELMATRMAQYWLSPPASPVQIKTWHYVSTVAADRRR